MKGLIGKKIGMTSVFREDGTYVPCTILEVPDNYVVQIKTLERDGYEAVQLGAYDKKEKRVNKPLLKHFEKAGVTPKYFLKEFEFDNISELKPGDVLKVEEIFQEGEYVNVRGRTKGKGFQGVVKRHGFAGVGGRTHGQHNRERAPGSLGAGSNPARVFKGKKMAGRMGYKMVMIRNLEVVKIFPEKKLMLVKGAVPGPRGRVVYIYGN